MFGVTRRVAAAERIADELRDVREQLVALATALRAGHFPVLAAAPAPAVGGTETTNASEDSTTALRAELVELRTEVERLRTQLAEHAAELADQRSVTAAAAGAARLDPVQHEELARRYHLLATQEFAELARLRSRAGTVRSGERSRLTARLVRELIDLMLGGGPVDEEELSAWLSDRGRPSVTASAADSDPRWQLTDAERRAVRNACDQTRRLRAELARSRQPMILVDEVPRDEPAAPGTVRPWRTCPADGTVDFVVVPSYVAGGEVFAPALVFTVESGPVPDAKSETW